jgi:uncharacterized protein
VIGLFPPYDDGFCTLLATHFFTIKTNNMESTINTATQTNVQLVQRGFNDFIQGNIADIVDHCTDDVQWGTFKVPDVPFTGTFNGKEGVQEYFSQLVQNVNFTSFEPKEFFAQGDRVLVLGRSSGTIKKTEKTFDRDWCMSFRIREEKIAEYFAFIDTYDIYRNYQG